MKEYLEHYGSPFHFMITRSIRNDFDFRVAYVDLLATIESFRKKALMSKFDPWSAIDNWVSTIEYKLSEDGSWNIHQHLIAGSESENLDISIMRKLWRRAAKDKAAHCDVRRANDVQHAANYVTKYITKPQGGFSVLSDVDKLFLKGRRLHQTKKKTQIVKQRPQWALCCQGDGGFCRDIDKPSGGSTDSSWDKMNIRLDKQPRSV